MSSAPDPPPYRVEAHSFQFKAGVDTSKLNRLLDDLDAEEFLHKMALGVDAQPAPPK
jgi:hypothetical protein